MPYGTIKVDNITFTDNSVDKTVSLSGLIQNPTFTGNVTATGTISGDVIRGGTTISGVTVTGTTANFVSGVFTTRVSGVTITGTTVAATTGTFTSLTGTTTTGTTANFVSGVFTTQISGVTVIATTGTFTSLTGTTTTGTTANFVSGVFTTQVSGATITGTTVATTTGSFVSLTGTTATFTSGIIASGTEALPSLAILSDPNTGIYSPGADQLAISTNGAERLRLSSTGEFMFKGAGTTPGTDKAVYFSGSAPVNSVVLDPSGRLLVGTATARSNVYLGVSNITPQNQVETLVSNYSGGLCLTNNSTSGYSPVLTFGQSYSASIGGNGLTPNGEPLGIINFTGNDGTNFRTAATIEARVDGTSGAGDMPGRLVFSTTADGAASPTERMRISQNGSISMTSRDIIIRDGIGSTNRTLEFGSAASGGGNSQSNILLATYGGLSGTRIRGSGSYDYNLSASLTFATSTTSGVLTDRMSIDGTGAVNIVGSLSKGSGSFKIDHPLPNKTNTHYLVHSFIEGPQADLIYRGHVNLINGKAIINIDEAARMSEGTFNALCTNVCCFTSNESDWTAVRGSVSDNILTIEAQDIASTAEVCWMVIGERKDQHMLDTNWTDENGRVVTEPLKEVTPSVTL